MAQLTLQGRRAFYREKQNTPLGAEDALFDSGRALHARYIQDFWEVYTPETDIVVRRIPSADMLRVGFLDAAMGKRASLSRGDVSAMATVLVYTDGTMVLEDVWARRVSPSAQVKRLLDRHEEFPYDLFAIEGNGFQELFLPLVEEEKKARRRVKRRADLALTVVHPKKSKLSRIAALEPLITNGTLALGGNLDEEFWEELANYPRSSHDDALDAVAGAVQLARERGARAFGWERVGRRIGTRRSFF